MAEGSVCDQWLNEIMNLHLLSTPGENDLSYVLEASRPHLEDKDDPVVAYMPLASLYAEKWHGMNESAFKGLAQLKEINAELMAQKEIENIIRDAALVYITGGNTFLLNHRLHVSRMLPYLKKKIQNGLPVVAVSDGAYIKAEGKKTSLVRGEVWILRKDQEKERLEEGKLIVL